MRELKMANPPEEWRGPNGPYQQAPAEYGGEWWFVSPFSNPQPWLKQGPLTPGGELPEGFEQLFGGRPKWQDYDPDLMAFEAAKVNFQEDLDSFGGVVQLTPEQLAFGGKRAAFTSVSEMHRVFGVWKMGTPVYYQDSRFGLIARFPEAQLLDFEGTYHSIATAGHNTIADYQEQLYLRKGIKSNPWHPFVSPLLTT